MILEREPVTIGQPPDVLQLKEIYDAAEKLTENEPEKLITYNYDLQPLEAYKGEVTLVMCREIKRTVELACAVSMVLSNKYKEENVVIFNTYASAELLTEGFVHALYLFKMKVPWVYQKYMPNAHISQFDDSVELPSPANLKVVDCPTSILTPKMLRAEIERNNAHIVMINSLEFAAFSDRRKKELAECILDLHRKKGLSFFVFSHELRPLLPYTGGRGALGLLSAFSKSVWHIVNEWEQRYWVKRLKEIQI